MVKESIALSYQEGASDKVYNAELVENQDGFLVNFAYGRRGNSLTTGTKTKEPVAYDVAKKAYDKLVKSKSAKGYKEEGSAQSINTVAGNEDSGIRPQLLNELTEEEAQRYINDDNYCMQEKFDGRRRLIIREETSNIIGVNKKGLVVALPPDIIEDCQNIPIPCILDGEDMGECIMLFDDLKESYLPYKDRYEELRNNVEETVGLRIVKTAWDKRAKQNMFNRLMAERAEGVVFKNIHASYTSGRPASGGSQFKCKFYESASCVVTSIHPVKSSVSVNVYDKAGIAIPVGNVTIYPNSPKVSVGDVVEVKYLYYNEGGSLYQPVLLGVRDDVDPQECLLSKLKRKKDGQD